MLGPSDLLLEQLRILKILYSSQCCCSCWWRIWSAAINRCAYKQVASHAIPTMLLKLTHAGNAGMTEGLNMHNQIWDTFT